MDRTAAVEPDRANLPRCADRPTGAELVTRFFFKVSPRTLETWPLDWRLVNGRAVCETAALFAVAQAKLDAAPLLPNVHHRALPDASAAAQLLDTPPADLNVVQSEKVCIEHTPRVRRPGRKGVAAGGLAPA
jgi:hypothetical protein